METEKTESTPPHHDKAGSALRRMGGHRGNSPVLDGVVEALVGELRARSEFGMLKYKQLLSRTDWTRKDRLMHALQEALDLSNYLMAEIVAEEKRLSGEAGVLKTAVDRSIGATDSRPADFSLHGFSFATRKERQQAAEGHPLWVAFVEFWRGHYYGCPSIDEELVRELFEFFVEGGWQQKMSTEKGEK